MKIAKTFDHFYDEVADAEWDSMCDFWTECDSWRGGRRYAVIFALSFIVAKLTRGRYHVALD
jgi:hypothetical protein